MDSNNNLPTQEKEQFADVPADAMVQCESPTLGMKAVGISFNPSGDQRVNKIKQLYAHIIDDMNALRSETKSGEQQRLASIAITEAQGAQMWAVKAVTWKD